MKLPHESFGDTIERLCKNFTAENLIKWFDTAIGWEDMTDTEEDELNYIIKKFQKDFILSKPD